MYISESIGKCYHCLIFEIIWACEVGLSIPSPAGVSEPVPRVEFSTACMGGFQACTVTLTVGKFLPVDTFHTSPRVSHAQQDSVPQYGV